MPWPSMPGTAISISHRYRVARSIWRTGATGSSAEALCQVINNPVLPGFHPDPSICRVGDDYFRQLCALYRERFPSRSGDLHWAGRDFAAFLENHLDGSDYAWLAELACLEWSRAECLVASESPALGVDALTNYSVEALEQLVFKLQPSLRLHAFAFPVFTVWITNQGENAPPVDQSLGSEQGMIHMRRESVEVRRLDPGLHCFLSALVGGAPLGDAVSAAEMDASALTHALAFVFNEGLVSSLSLRA